MSANIDRLLVIVEQVEAATGRKWTEQQTAIWLSVLSDLPIDAVNAGYKKWSATFEGGWPMPATIRRLAIETMGGQITSVSDAWEPLLRCVRRFGYYGKAEAKAVIPPLVWRALGGDVGWDHLCEMEAGQRATYAAQFRQRYQELHDQEQRARALPEHLRPRINNEPVSRLDSPPVPMPKLKSPEDFRHNDNSERERQFNLLREARNDAG